MKGTDPVDSMTYLTFLTMLATASPNEMYYIAFPAKSALGEGRNYVFKLGITNSSFKLMRMKATECGCGI